MQCFSEYNWQQIVYKTDIGDCQGHSVISRCVHETKFAKKYESSLQCTCIAQEVFI